MCDVFVCCDVCVSVHACVPCAYCLCCVCVCTRVPCVCGVCCVTCVSASVRSEPGPFVPAQAQADPRWRADGRGPWCPRPRRWDEGRALGLSPKPREFAWSAPSARCWPGRRPAPPSGVCPALCVLPEVAEQEPHPEKSHWPRGLSSSSRAGRGVRPHSLSAAESRVLSQPLRARPPGGRGSRPRACPGGWRP